MKNGKCIKCTSDNVFVKEYELNTLTLNGTRIANQSYICTDCGYFETYITDKAALGKIITRAEKLGDWKKVK
ncbi:MAG: hypothetical protein FJZ96_00380 [Chloroflexi bacterium]|nr:hypothetical protein [Chloroflexota bacterium]